jgi:hypothetical protein
MYNGANSDHQDIDIYKVGCIQKSGRETSWKMVTQKTEDDGGSVTVIWDVILCSTLETYKTFRAVLMHEK